MAPAVGARRSWGKRSLGGTCKAATTAGKAMTADKVSKRSSPNQDQAGYVWNGEAQTSARSTSADPHAGVSVGRQQRAGGSGPFGAGVEERSHPPPRYSSLDTTSVARTGDGESGGTSPSIATNDTNSSSTGPTLRFGGRASTSRGGSDFPRSDSQLQLQQARAARHAAAVAARIPQVYNPTANASLGVTGADSGSCGDLSSKQRSHRGGKREGEHQRAQYSQDVPNSDVNSPGVCSASPRKDEAPPGLDPLDSSSGSGMLARRHRRPVGQADADVQVAFPPNFDDRRKSRSGSEGESSSSSKARGSSDSLGTKSGSTSLLSMLSGSPRSLGTAHDSAAGSSPRTPLSDHSSTAGSTRGGSGSRGRRASSVASVAAADAAAPGDLGHEPWSSSSTTTAPRRAQKEDLPPEVSVREAGDGGGDGEFDDMDLPSAHPTPLSAVGGETQGPSDHPSMEPNEGEDSSAGRSRSQRRTSGAAGEVTSTKSSVGSSFAERLKYWGGAGRKASAASSGSAPAKNVHGGGGGGSSDAGVTSGTDANEVTLPSSPAARTPASSPSFGVSPRKPPVLFNASLERRTSSHSKSSSSGSLGHDAERRSGGSLSVARRAVNSSLSDLPQPPSYYESTTSGVSAMSSSELRGCQVRPFDSVTSDAMEAHDMGPPPAYRPWGVDQSAAVTATATLPLPPFLASQEERTGPRPGSGSRSSRQSAGGGSRSTPPVQSPTPSAVSRNFSDFGASHRAELMAMRRARGAPSPADEDVKDEEEEKKSEDESDMDSDASSSKGGAGNYAYFSPVKPLAVVKAASPRPPPRYLATTKTSKTSTSTHSVDVAPQELQQPRQSPRQAAPSPTPLPPPPPPPPPRYMAIVEAANVRSALDNSSTSENTDASPSEDDGGMMAEILTDRLMEVCSKMEQVVTSPEDELSDGPADSVAVGGGSGVHKRRPSSRRRQHSNMSSRTLHSTVGDIEENDADSDEGSTVDAGAAARKLRRERLRKRTKQSRKLSSVLAVPKDDRGEVINLHTAAYNGEREGLTAYIAQGGDLEVRDKFQATALMLCTERGHNDMVEALVSAGAEASCVDENGNSALHLACFYGNLEAVELLLAVDADIAAVDSEGRTPLNLATDPNIRRVLRNEEFVRYSGENFDLLAAVEVNDTTALANFIAMGQEACGFPHNPNAVAVAAKRLRLDRVGRGGMSAAHLAAFHGYADSLCLLLEAGADANAVCDDGETPLHTACNGGSLLCASLLLDHGANPLATDGKGLVPCEKHIAGGRQEMKQLLESKAFQATPANLLSLRSDLAAVALQIDAEEDLFVRKGVAIKYLRRALKKKDVDIARLRQAVEARDTDIRNLADRMEGVHRLLKGIYSQ